MWPFSKWRTLFAASPAASSKLPLHLHNTLSGKDELFSLPPRAHIVRMYNCGPTVYDVSHIGNLRSYVFADLLHRTLVYNGYSVKQVINITDFGHLSSDADAGPDKMTKALKREGLELTMENMRSLAEKYAKLFIKDLQALNIDTSRIEFPRASAYVRGEIALIHTLEEKGYTYRGRDGVYYDTSRFPEYGKLGDIDIAGLKAGARVAASEDKRHPSDFLLWKSDKKLGWDSPWGKGFPGWHIECSAMINATLGKQIDIHTGGVDLMSTHHNNEIAQSEAATGKKPFSRFWMHHEFLNIQQEKISKSLGNMVNLSELIARGYHPLSYRYFLLGAHYRSPMNFTWDALDASQTALQRLAGYALEAGGTVLVDYKRRFHERINDNLDTPGALAVLWEMTKDFAASPAGISATLRDADEVLGLGFSSSETLKTFVKNVVDISDVPSDVALQIDEREKARSNKDWARADELRNQIADAGYDIKDTAEGPEIRKR